MEPRVVRPRTPARRAFTLLEMLVAIGIILVLVTIAVVAFQSLDRSASRKSTQVRLQTLSAMIAEYETTGRSIVDAQQLNNGGKPLALSLWAGSTFGDVRVGGTARANAALYSSRVLGVLTRIPKNKQVLQSLPPKAVMTNYTDQPPVPVVDAWGNPIIFVPAAGLEGVALGQRADGTFETPPTTSTNPLKSPDNRPFWASAGPDGILSAGDDNLYSFEK